MCLALIRAPTAADSDAGRVSHAKHAQVTPFYQLGTTREPVCLLRATHEPHLHLQAPPLPPRRLRFAFRLPRSRLRASSAKGVTAAAGHSLPAGNCMPRITKTFFCA